MDNTVVHLWHDVDIEQESRQGHEDQVLNFDVKFPVEEIVDEQSETEKENKNSVQETETKHQSQRYCTIFNKNCNKKCIK
jgi:hypothetical protein